MKKKIHKPFKITKKDLRDMLVDVLAIQGMAKEIFGDEILVPDDFGVELYTWEYRVGRLVTSKNPPKELKTWLKYLK